MPKRQSKSKSPKLDMNPMTDLAFLLVTFFMLTTTFKAEEPVEIQNPSSRSEIKLPESNIVTITISDDGRVLYGLDGKYTRERLLDFMASQHQLSFTEEQKRTFSLLPTFGVPISELASFLDLDFEARNSMEQSGIPIDSSANELAEWIVYSRLINPKLRIAINGDEETTYPVVSKVISTLVNNNVTRFNLITNKETALEDEASES